MFSLQNVECLFPGTMMPGRCVMNMQSVKHIYTPGLCTFVYNRTICESRIRSQFHYLKNVRGMCLAVSLYPKTKLIFPYVRHKILVIPCQSYNGLVLQPRRKINSFVLTGWLYNYTDYKKKIVLDTINSYTLCTKHLSTVANFQPVTPLFIQAKKYPDRIAVIDKAGTHTYDKINTSSDLFANTIVQKLKSAYPNGVEGDVKTVSFLCGNDVSYVVAQWAIWKSSCVCVPLCASHPVSEIEYFVNDSRYAVFLQITTRDISDKKDIISQYQIFYKPQEWEVLCLNPGKILAVMYCEYPG